MRECENQQQALAEAEDFEGADALSSKIEAIKQQTGLRATALRDLTTDGDAVEREKGGKRAEQVKKLDTMVSSLEEFQTRNQRKQMKVSSASPKSQSERMQTPFALTRKVAD